MNIGVAVVLAAMLLAGSLIGCADSDALGSDGKPRAAGTDGVKQAVGAYVNSAPIRRVGQYADAVGQGLMSPLAQNAEQQRLATLARLKRMNPPRPLADDEQCVGSSVIRVDRTSKVPSYVQVLQNGRPIYCEEPALR